MAIGWAGAFYIQRSRGGSAARTIAYNTRSEIFDERQGELWKGTHKIATLRHAEAMLPDGADERFRNFGLFANTLEASEKRRDSVLGRDIITPLPRGASLEAQIELARGFFQERFVDRGVPVILTLHRQDDDHAHGFVPGRYLEKDRWSAKKAVVPEPERHNWSAAWREYQERRGISVDAPALIPGKHLGPRHSLNPTSELFRRQAERDKLNKTRSLSQRRGQMELSDGTNTQHERDPAAMKSQDLAKLSNEQIIAGLWQAANAPLSEQEQAIRQERGVEANQKDRLYNQYKAEKAYALSARKDAEQEVFSRFAAYRQSLGSFYAIQHEQQKLEVRRGSERRKEHEVLKAEHGRDRVEAQQLRRQQLAAVRQGHQIPTWDSFLRREARRGDKEAEQALLRHERAQERVQEQDRSRGD